jgi:hypothetical protein
MADTATVESPASTPPAVGGSKSSNAPASAPAGTSVTHGTASAALIANATKMMEAEAGASSASTQPGGIVPPGDTSGATPPAGSAATAPPQEPPTGQQPPEGGAEGTRNPQLEARFQTVARNAQAKVLQALGLSGVTYQQLPALARDIGIGRGLLADLRKDPRAFHARLGAELEGAGGAPEAPFTLPQGKLKAEDGTFAYSADQMAEILAGFKKDITRELLQNGRIQDVISFVDGESERRSTEEAENARKQTISSVLTEMREKPHFKENEKDVIALIAAWNHADPARLRQRGVAWAVQAAYDEILQKKVYGVSYEANIEAKIREDMRKKAGSTTIVDANVRGGDGKKPELNSVDALAEHMRRMEATGA